ncbi:MAG: outer membrane lipoprotein-sorting protein [Candidatus Zixiibacteriota bacterium]
MKTTKAFLRLALTMIFSMLPVASTPSEEIDVQEIVHQVDQLYRSRFSYSEVEMEIVTPHWQRTLSMQAWTQGMDQTFIRITAPDKEKGMATLRIKNEMWNYLPKTNKVIKIPPSMMMSSWMGSDFTNDDLVKEFSLYDDFSYQLIPSEKGSEDTILINCIPRPDLPVVWHNIVIAVRKEDHLPVWQKYYNEKGQLMRILNYSDVKKFGTRTLPATMEMIPQREEGHKTVIRYLTLDFDRKINPEVFSLRNLRGSN